ncbi:hypothetical protein SAMD00019534_017410, partial [Acytostelium subglobosum LB1]|uniref:hypothetical protein n=1 Tax=Acytostelium subglobosum LB1 TaxID=1410327 RepID=UPI0006451AB9
LKRIVTIMIANCDSESFSVEEVAKHDTVEDAWVTLDGNVFDVSQFIYDHPGGSEIVAPHLGKDISQVFLDDTEHEHSETAYNMLQRYKIGTLRGYRKSAPSVSELIRSKVKLSQLNNLNTVSKDQSLEGLVDVTKAILPQLKNLPGSTYLRWIHSQTGLKEIIIFDSPFLELFTRWPWWYIFPLWIPIITLTFYTSITQPNSSVLFSAIVFTFGLFSWSFFEYILHRFIFHIETSSYMGNFLHFFIHGIHHLTPYDATRLTFPPMFSAVIAFGFWKLFLGFPDWLQATGFNWALYGGIAFGYMLYDTLHYYFHHGDISWLPEKLKEFKSNHLNHHYKDDTKNFGITSTIFDIMFGT